VLDAEAGEAGALAKIAASLEELEPEERRPALRLLEALAQILKQ
jgi:hypothetical protein